jgi:TLC domain
VHCFVQVVAGACVTYLAGAGLVLWFSEEAVALQKNPFYGYSQNVVDHLIAPMISYQGWNFILCLFVPELRDVAMLGHHFVTLSLAYFGLHPYLHYFGLYYFGVAELTNVPLTLVDVFKYLGEEPKKKELKKKDPDNYKDEYHTINEVSRVSFAVSFIGLRLIAWPVISLSFWNDSYQLLSGGKAHSNFVVGYFLFANLFLTGLQFFWGSKIFGFLFKKKAKKTDSTKEDKLQ